MEVLTKLAREGAEKYVDVQRGFSTSPSSNWRRSAKPGTDAKWRRGNLCSAPGES